MRKIKNKFKNFFFEENFLTQIVNFLKSKNQVFENLKRKKKKKIVLIEFNSYHSFIIVIYYILLSLKENFELEIKCFYNFFIIKNNFKNTQFKKIYIKLFFFFSLYFSKLYKFLGCKKIIIPKKDYNFEKKIKKNFKKIKNLKELLNYRVEGVLVGDLLYDTYLMKNHVPTIDINSKKFEHFFLEFNFLVYFWVEYFKENKVDYVIGPHLVYSYGLPLRIGKKNNATSIVATLDVLYKLKHHNQYQVEHWTFKRKKFRKKDLMHNRKWSKSRLNEIFAGKDLKITPTLKVSSFSKIQRKSLIKSSNKIKVLVLPHDFFDAPHAWGNKGIFPDYFKWLEFIKKMAKITNYDWYIKTHPNFIGQYGDNQKKSRELVKKMFFGIKNLKILPPNFPYGKKIDFDFMSRIIAV